MNFHEIEPKLDQMVAEDEGTFMSGVGYVGKKSKPTLPAWQTGITASALMAMQFEPIRYVAAFNYPQVVAAEIRFDASRLVGMTRL